MTAALFIVAVFLWLAYFAVRHWGVPGTVDRLAGVPPLRFGPPVSHVRVLADEEDPW